MGERSSLALKKHEAIYAAYKRARVEYTELEAAGKKPEQGIHKWSLWRANNTRQPRFWISAGRAARIISGMLKGRRSKTQTGNKPMHHELMQAYNKLRKNPEYRGMALFEISYYVVHTPCSGFFLSHDRIYRTVIEMAALHKKRRNP